MTYEQSVMLTGSQWTELSEERKLEVLQTIENHSAFEAGRLSCPVVGKFLYTGTDGVVLGTYDPKNQVIYVNSSQFASDTRYGKDSEAIVTACLHEGRHAYQHQVADGIVLHDNQAEADAWKENLSEDFNPRSPHGERLRKVTILSIRIIGFAQKVYHKTVLLRISLAENAVILPEKPRNPVRTSLQKAGGLRFARAIRAARPYSISSPSGA